MTDVVETEVTEETVEANRIPDILAGNMIYNDFATQFLAVIDEITSYNQSVLQAPKSEWNNAKLNEAGRKLARPEDPKVKGSPELLKFLTTLENAQDALNLARKSFLDAVAEKLGVVRDVTAERDLEKEADLKNKRAKASLIGTHLRQMGELTSDSEVSAAVKSFLDTYEMPAVGRNSATSFGGEGAHKSVPRYRCSIKIEKDGVILLDAGEGFTKTAAMLSRPEFGLPKEKRLTAEDFRNVWEKAGNSSENPKAVPEVVFKDDSGLVYTLTYNG